MDKHNEDTINQEVERELTSFLVHSLESTQMNLETAKAILEIVMKRRRLSGADTACAENVCSDCIDLHLTNVLVAVEIEAPVTLVLPAFPAKSPNLAKVFGPLPDMAEEQALISLQHLCDQIKEFYAPGAQIILCADGRVFSDIIGIRDEDVTAYQIELSTMIKKLNLTSISTFNLDELYAHLNFDQMRAELMKNHGDSIESLKESVKRGNKIDSTADDKEAHRLFCGITRFMLEDASFPGQKKSKTALQKESRVKAYEVIQRSKAWGNLVAEYFPHAVRLSIHPQTCGSKKIGIRLIEPDNWITPWHAVAVEVGGEFLLLKRAEAEKIGAKLVHKNGRPSHFVLKDKKHLLKLQEV